MKAKIRTLYYLLCVTMLFPTLACEPVGNQDNEQEKDEIQSFNIELIYGKWCSNTEYCVFKKDLSGYTFDIDNESVLTHFTWNLTGNELVLKFGNMLNAQIKYYIITELTKETLKFYDKNDVGIKHVFLKPIESYIKEEAIYRTWAEGEILYHYKYDGTGIKENEDGLKDNYSWRLTQDKLTIAFENNYDSQIYIVTELSDTIFSYHNANDESDKHTLLPYHETYKEQKERERKNIQRFIESQSIKVIDRETFFKNDSCTNVEENEFVLFEDKGVYMQIVRKGEGRMMENGERTAFLARYLEYNIASADTISGNLYASFPDKFTCERKGDTFSATFTQGYMYAIYGSAVPSGWLLPFSYITPGRPNAKAAKVRLIVPHSEGTSVAAMYVYPTYYEITLIPERY